MSGETYYKVTTTVTLTIQAGTPENAIDVALLAIGEGSVGGLVRGVTTDRDLSSAKRIEHDPKELARMERWLDEKFPTHPFVDETSPTSPFTG